MFWSVLHSLVDISCISKQKLPSPFKKSASVNDGETLEKPFSMFFTGKSGLKNSFLVLVVYRMYYFISFIPNMSYSRWLINSCITNLFLSPTHQISAVLMPNPSNGDVLSWPLVVYEDAGGTFWREAFSVIFRWVEQMTQCNILLTRKVPRGV